MAKDFSFEKTLHYQNVNGKEEAEVFYAKSEDGEQESESKKFNSLEKAQDFFKDLNKEFKEIGFDTSELLDVSKDLEEKELNEEATILKNIIKEAQKKQNNNVAHLLRNFTQGILKLADHLDEIECEAEADQLDEIGQRLLLYSQMHNV